MYYVYLLKSTFKNFYYTGYTDNLKNRVFKHQKGMVKSTKPHLPFELCITKLVLTKKTLYLERNT